MGYKILEHTSDLYIEGEGKGLKEALEGLSKGMFANMGNAKKENKLLKIESRGYDEQLMVVELFSKILSECEAESVIPKRMEIKKIDLKNKKINAEVYGESGNLSNIIKAVTYNSFGIEREKDKTIVRILFDI